VLGNLGGDKDSWLTSIPNSGAPSAASAGTANTTLTVQSDAANATGTSNTSGFNYALSGSTSDRSLGFSPTSGSGLILQLRLTNNTSAAISAIRVGYGIRRFRNASSAEVMPGYRLFVSSDNGSTWTNVTSLNPVASGGTVNVPNTTGTTTIPLTNITLPSAVAVGSEVRFRWVDDNGVPSPDQIVGLDNVSIQLPVVNALPTATLTAPAAGATFDAPATVNLTADATDTDGTISKVEFFRGAVKLGEDLASPYEFAWTNVLTGSYSLTAVATDNLGGVTTSTAVNITVTNLDNVAPTVSLTAPANGSTILANSVALAANAADTDGVVSKVEFFNGATKLGEDLTSPFTFNWTGVASGNYTLTAVATDNDSATTTSSAVSISVAIPIQTTLIARRPVGQPGAVWKYLDNGSNQGTAWKETGFNDSAWASGAAPLGYTDSHIVTTVNSPAAPNRTITTYFRRSFNVTGAAAIQALNLNILRDDGVVVYINGTEVARQNMPAGAIDYLTFSSAITDGADETTYFASTASPLPVLVEGANTIAVELHQRDGNSSDLGFDLELISLALPGTPPTVTLTAPDEGSTFDAPATINLAATASDSDGTIAKVEFFQGTTKIGEDTSEPYEFTWTGVISGTYFLSAVATDNAGSQTTSAAEDIIVTNANNVAPTVALTAPANNSTILTNSVALAANAADTDGVVSKVEFFNGATKLGEDLTSPYTFNWTGVATGAYTITAVATDNDSATTTSSAVNISVAVPISTTLVAKGATWKYLDNGSDQGTAWKETGFNDTTWASGPAVLGGGDAHVVTNVNLGPSGARYITTYFRRTFNVTGAAAVQALNMNILRDDGVVVWINGVEVARQNMPAGAINYLTDTPDIVSGADETTYFASAASPLSALVNGVNTIAVEVHQRDGASSDLGFDLELISLALPGTPPTVAITAPVEGTTFNAPATVSITADANDTDGTITKVEFFNGATKLGEDLDAPYAYNWTTVPQGSYTLTAKVTDNFGLTATSAPVNISVGPPNTIAPTVAITAPANNANFIAPASVSIAADAVDSDGTVTKVEFFNGATKLGEDTEAPYLFTWTNVPAGSYVLTAKATDNLTATTTSAPVTITVNPNQAPTIALASPANSASLGSSGIVNLTATLADPEAAPLTVTFYGRPKLAPPGPDFTIVTLPDTQFYSENSGGNRFQFFTNQTSWIVASKNLLNTQFVAHMGDMTQSYNTVVQEYLNASQAMAIIENPATTLLTHGIPWGGAPGNHDIASGGSTVMWNDYFGLGRFATRTVANGGYFGGGYTDNTTDNNYQLFSASGLDFIVINLKYNSSTAGNAAVMNWADALLKAHPNRRAIVTSHWLVGTSLPPTQAAWGGHGQAVYDNLKDNPNLFLMLCGHIHGEGRRADTFQGRTVNTVLQDYQSRSNGGDSWLRYFTFSPANDTITARTYKTNTAPVGNPLGGTFETDADSQFTLNYDMSGGSSSWTALGTVNVPGGTGTASIAWTGLATNTEYEWYAAVSDSVNPPVGSTTRGFTTNGNAAPSVSLTSPANGASFNLPATVPLSATAADIDGSITKVEFYQGNAKLGEDTEAPFTFDWAAPAGSYSLAARATDGQGASTNSAAVAITVTEMIPEVTVTATDAAAGEFGPDQTLVFTVSRTGPTTAPLNVQLSATGRATPGSDYNGFTTLFEIPASQASADLTLTVLADNLSEGPETVLLTVLPAALYNPGTPATAQATIADRPAQGFYFDNIADAAKRAPTMDADNDGKANIIEYFMGTLPGDAGSNGVLTIPSTGVNTFKVRYPRAKNRPDVSGSLRWSADLVNWHTSGQSNGTQTVTFAEAVVSATEVNPETVEATATITGTGQASKIFVRLGVE
jgi:hypothetical protein